MADGFAGWLTSSLWLDSSFRWQKWREEEGRRVEERRRRGREEERNEEKLVSGSVWIL